MLENGQIVDKVEYFTRRAKARIRRAGTADRAQNALIPVMFLAHR
jgi:hypothetical protein